MSTAVVEPKRHRQPVRQLTHCCDCGRLSWENEFTCGRCGNQSLERTSKAGEVYSYTTVRDGDRSFVLALVKLNAGPMVMGRVLNTAERLTIGLPVEFTPQAPVGEVDQGGLLFTPAANS